MKWTAKTLDFLGLPLPETEFVFAPPRKWRFDFAWPEQKIAVEQEGGLWIQGRHNRAASMIKDMDKYNTAARLGWKVGRFTPQQVKAGDAARWVSMLLNGK